MKTMRLRISLVASLLSILSVAPLCAQYGDDFTGPRPVNGDRAKALYRAHLKKYKDATDVLVLPGLVANRKERRVEVLAESTGLRSDSAAEFLVVDQSSSHGYEALVWSFAKPSDVHAALVFIGLEAGEPFDPGQLRFWGKGAMVDVSVAVSNEAPFLIEQLVYDRQKDEDIPASGFIFTGSFPVPARDGESEPSYGADIYEPKAVISLFNTPVTVLDVPRQASQGDVYSSHVVNPDHELAGGKLLTLVMVPRPGDDEAPEKSLVLEVGLRSEPGGGETNVAPVRTPVFILKNSDGEVLAEDATVAGPVKALSGFVGKGNTPYLSILFDENLPLEDVRRNCLIVGLIEEKAGIKIEPPAAGQLYYKAFTPDERWCDRDSRPSQPWELHLARTGGRVAGSLVFNEPVWSDDSSVPTYEVTLKEIANPADVKAALDGDAAERKKTGKQAGFGVLLVFAGADLTYGELLAFMSPVQSSHSLVHVFLEPGN